LAPTFDIDNVTVVLPGTVAYNAPPVANRQSVEAIVNSFQNLTLTGYDPEGSNLTYSVVDTPTNGVLTGTAPNLTYTPDTDSTGSDSFTFTVNDGELNSNPATVSISVYLQEPPVADPQSVNVEKNTFVDITLTGSDPEGSNLTYSVEDAPTNGVLSLVTNQTYTYTPDTDYTGPDSFTFTVNDGETNSEPATVSIVVFATPEGTLYEEDFSTDPGYTNAGTTAIGAAGGAGTYFTFGDYNGSGDIGETTDTGVLHFDSNTDGNSARSRGLSVFIDTSAAVAGTYTVSFDVLNYVGVATNGTAGFKVVEGSGLDTLYIELDNAENNDSGNTPRFNGTATDAEIGTTGAGGTGILGNGTVSFDVELTEAGQAGDYLALAWTQVRSTSGAVAPKFDIDNVLVSVVTPGDLYNEWALSFGLLGADTNGNADVEYGGLGDGLDNLMEYALGGNPTNDDAAAVSPDTFMVDAAGTNWFYHVHNQNTDTDLTFTVGATTNLVATAADTNDVEWIGETAESGGFKSVTNRTEMTTDAKFIKLEVSQ